MASAVTQQSTMRAAGAALLDRIGPAIVLTHSQSGPYGWLIADARPTLVKGLLQVEPSGPPFYDVVQLGAPTWFADGSLSRPWGITSVPITYYPAVSEPRTITARRNTSRKREWSTPSCGSKAWESGATGT